ncbi:MAG TPA: hypothetical protein VFO70_11650, partial [Chitinophagaceae bacterium]|nr:hypothetical protein [Chitinophagaceae bacterium]
WAYGNMFYSLMQKINPGHPVPRLPWMLTCFSGLAFLGLIFTALSLLMPLGGWLAQVFLVVPALLFYLLPGSAPINFPGLWKKIKSITSIPAWISLPLAASVLLVLTMHAWVINHPDTLAYHAQNIKWVEDYPAVPGIANLKYHYGLQSSWFVLCALFSFGFTGTNALTFVNATIIIWFLAFVFQRIQVHIEQGEWKHGLLWLLLLVIAFWSYTQIRLTLTSASPDFPAVLFSWFIFYLFLRQNQKADIVFYLSLIVFAFFAASIKLFAIPVIVFTFICYYFWFKPKGVGKLLLPVIFALLAFAPFLARNFISSGYVLFPSPAPDLFQVDWKAPGEQIVSIHKYIKAYARTQAGEEDFIAVSKMNAAQWMPVWWNLRSIADKTLLAITAFLFVCSILFARKIYIKKNRPFLPVFVCSILGMIFWFTRAPDPRFGFGYLVAFCGIILYLMMENMVPSKKNRLVPYGTLILGLVIFAYTIYRLTYFFRVENLVYPSGIENQPYQKTDYNEITFNIPADSSECGSIPLPCTKLDKNSFEPRGKSIESGFRSKTIH